MPPRLPKPVPWNSPSEFRQLYEWFYPPRLEDGSPDIRAQECAMRRVKAWEARGKLPHAIDSTMAFVQVILRDWSGVCSDQDLRAMYSMVIIRFVNGYVDGFQTAKTAKSIAYLAQEKIGMPLWFVELRHTATHDYLPSLTILRRAADEALAWMNINYWIPQLNAITVDEEPSEEMTSAMVNDVRSMIQNHRDQKEQQIAEMSLLPPKQETVAMNRLMKELLRRCGTGDHLLDALLTILLEPGMLVPKSKKKRASTQDLTLGPLGDMVQACWMPLMTRLHGELKDMSSIKTGDVLLFWDEMMDSLLEELQASSGGSGGGSQSSMAMEVDGGKGEKGSRPTSYLLTATAWIKHLIAQHYQRAAAAKRHATSMATTTTTTTSTSTTPAVPSSSLSSPSNSPSISSLSVSATTSTTTSTTVTSSRPSFASMAAKLVSSSSVNQATANGPEFDTVYIAQTCLEKPNPFTRSVLNTIMQHDPEIKSRIEHLVKRIDQQLQGGAGTGTPSVVTDSPAPSISSTAPPPATSVDHDMASPPKAATPSTTQAVPSPCSPQPPTTTTLVPDTSATVHGSSSHDSGLKSTTVWTILDDSVWRPTPMGCLPGGILPDLSLPWDLDAQPIARMAL
ncbi:rRNA-processing protein las1 [Actinomortierella ambigua]|nr:rRNA-processing protein las1 [Actinomortierella ambigua]